MAGKLHRAESNSAASPHGLRSPSSASDIMSASGRSLTGALPPTTARPAYISWDAAENLAGAELDRPTSISEPALDLVNSFLDQTLYNLLGLSKSTSLPALRLAVPKLLKPRLGQAAVSAADEDLREMAGDDNADADADNDRIFKPTDFDLELAWKLARLRCMAYARLGDMEDEDAEEYLEQEGLSEHAYNSQMSIGSNSTLFVTSVLEFLGEQALCTAAQQAEKRHAHTLSKAATGHDEIADDNSEVVIDAADVMQLGREGPLSRLWRSWRRDTRAFEPSNTRSNTPGVMMSPNPGDPYHSRTNSLASPDQTIPEETTPGPSSPSQIPLPMRANDIDEIEVPGLAPTLEEEQDRRAISVPEKSNRRPLSMVIMPGGYVSPQISPSQGRLDHQELSPWRPQWYRSRSQSLPTATQDPLVRSFEQAQRPSGEQNGTVDGKEPPAQTRDGDHDPDDEEPSGTETSTKLPSHNRASIISGAVGAIAGALGIEAMRSSSQNKSPKDSLTDHEERTQPQRTVAEQMLGPTVTTAPHSDAGTRASINSVNDFDDMHIPVMTNDEQSPHGVQRQREISDPEDLALSSADEENAARTAQHGLRDSGFGVAGNAQHSSPQQSRSIPSSPSSPKRMNREAAVFEDRMIPMRAEEDAETAELGGSQNHMSMQSDAYATTYATAPTSKRYSNSQYSQTDRNSASLPIQRPESGDQQTSAWPAVVPKRGSSLESPSKANHAHSGSRTSQYSQHSINSTTSSKLLGFERDVHGRPLSEQRAGFGGSTPPTTGHSRDISSAGNRTVVGSTATTAAASLVAHRQHLRLHSESGDRSQADEDKKKSLEILINSDETLHYTLTPESARPKEDASRAAGVARTQTQTQELAEFFRNTAPPGSEQQRPGTSKSTRTSMNALRSNPPDQLITPIEQRAAALAAAQAASQPRNPLGAPRDARPERNTTRDLADYVRSTGPTTTEQLPQAIGTRPHTGRSTALAGGLRYDGVPMAPPIGAPSIDSDRTTVASNTKSNRLKFQARDARTARDAETSDLIDFIREGPPRKVGEHRIDRHVAPFRTTMDSDDLNALAPPADLNGRSSVGSAHDSSVMTGRSVQESTNSRTGLLENHRTAPRMNNGANSSGVGVVRQTIAELDSDGRPPRKNRRGPRDPYAIDDSDDDALEEEMARPPQKKEESLIDFLRNTAPPPGMTTQPILSAEALKAQQQQAVKRSASQSKLKDVLKRQNSNANAVSMNGAVRATPTSSSNGSIRPTSSTARSESPHLTQVGSKMDKYRPTQPTHASHVDRHRKPRIEPKEATNVRTGTSDLADYLRNSGPPPSPRPSTGNGKFVNSDVKEQAGFLKFFKQRGTVKR